MIVSGHSTKFYDEEKSKILQLSKEITGDASQLLFKSTDVNCTEANDRNTVWKKVGVEQQTSGAKSNRSAINDLQPLPS